MKKYLECTIFAGLVSIFISFVPGAYAADLPLYAVDPLAPGVSASINDLNHVAGNSSPDVGAPWVIDENGLQYLPLTPDALGGHASDINNNDVIVGFIRVPESTATVDLPVRWDRDGTGGYDITLLPLLPGANVGVANSVNNLDQILVTSRGMFPWGTAYVVDGDIVTQLDFTSAIQINDNGLILGSNGLFNLNTMTQEPLPAPPDMYSFFWVYPHSINNKNQIGATLISATSLPEDRAAGIWTPGSGWKLVTWIGRYNSGGRLNDLGDMTVYNGTAVCPQVYLEGEGTFCLSSLVQEGDLDWRLSSASDIGNDRTLLAYGWNTALDFTGIAEMVPIGNLPVPAAPFNLVASPHGPTWQQPFVSIDLAWNAADTLARTYVVERKGPGDADFKTMAEVRTLYYRDMAIQFGASYAYRVMARGLAGLSGPSNLANAVAPAEPDREAPVVMFVTPQDGDTVSGNVSIEVRATDNVGVQYIFVSGTGLNCQASQTTTLSCTWQTRDLAAGTYALMATAQDALGNYDSTTISVNLQETVTGGGGGKRGGGGGKGRRK